MVYMVLGRVCHCYLALCDVACSFDPWTYSSWSSGWSAVLSSAWCLANRWPTGRCSMKTLNGCWTHCCFVWTGLDGGYSSDLLFIQCGCGLLNCARQLQQLQWQLLQASICNLIEWATQNHCTMVERNSVFMKSVHCVLHIVAVVFFLEAVCTYVHWTVAPVW